MERTEGLGQTMKVNNNMIDVDQLIGYFLLASSFDGWILLTRAFNGHGHYLHMYSSLVYQIVYTHLLTTCMLVMYGTVMAPTLAETPIMPMAVPRTDVGKISAIHRKLVPIRPAAPNLPMSVNISISQW